LGRFLTFARGFIAVKAIYTWKTVMFDFKKCIILLQISLLLYFLRSKQVLFLVFLGYIFFNTETWLLNKFISHW